MLANMVFYMVKNHRSTSLQDSIDLMRRWLWETYHEKNSLKRVVNYLEALYALQTAYAEVGDKGVTKRQNMKGDLL
jgi:hypothetical protein